MIRQWRVGIFQALNSMPFGFAKLGRVDGGTTLDCKGFRPMSGRLGRAILLSSLTVGQIFPLAAESVFSISPDGQEVTDSRTGLVWQRCPVGMSWDGVNCGGEPLFRMWHEALSAAMNAARADGVPWRLPNVKELSSILDRNQINPAIDREVFPATPNHQFWTATPNATDAFYAWVVDFYDGQVLSTYLEDMGAVRLVRDPN